MDTDKSTDFRVRPARESDYNRWDQYAAGHPNSTLYHLYRWKNVVESSYGHKAFYLMAERSGVRPNQITSIKAGMTQSCCTSGFGGNSDRTEAKHFEINGASNLFGADNTRNSINSATLEFPIVGVFPLVHIKHLLFGNNLISLPFFDIGGILADNEEVERALLTEAVRIARNVGAEAIELRDVEPLSETSTASRFNRAIKSLSAGRAGSAISATNLGHKVRMILRLPDSSEQLLKSFKSKLRSQIRKPIKEGLTSKIGGGELLDPFYEVFARNMRDLGSPVHSKTLIRSVLNFYQDRSRIILIYQDDKPMAVGIVIGFEETLENPWASSLREYSKLAPNMLLYWTMLEYACDHGYKQFDFGRCTPGEGSYRFKEQWGAKPEPLHWRRISLKGEKAKTSISEDSKFLMASEIWKKLPLSVTVFVGPMIRRYISL